MPRLVRRDLLAVPIQLDVHRFGAPVYRVEHPAVGFVRRVVLLADPVGQHRERAADGCRSYRSDGGHDLSGQRFPPSYGVA